MTWFKPIKKKVLHPLYISQVYEFSRICPYKYIFYFKLELFDQLNKLKPPIAA